MVPVTKTWKELGFKNVQESQVQVEKGADLFEKLSDAEKEKILGKAAFQAYKNGVVKLEDFVGRKIDKRWGSMRYARSLRDILGLKEARKWRLRGLRSPGSGGPSVPPSPPPSTGGFSGAEQAIRNIEDQIRRNPSESIYAVDRNGNIVFSKAGSQYEVDLTPTEMVQLRDTIVTHNHPKGLTYSSSDPRSQGNSFSTDDIKTAIAGDIAEMRAVTPTWRYIMKRPATGWDDWGQDIGPAFRRQQAAVDAFLRQEMQSGRITLADYEARFYHEVWSRVAQDLGMDYRREP